MTDITVVWESGDTNSQWTDKCAQIVESFGLPGDKYMTKVTEDYMIFSFVDAEDALIAKLMLGG